MTIITLNEEHNLPRCLKSVADLADQLIVVDSGSKDATREIAAAAGAIVHPRPFGGYGAQKQFALERATCDWVLCLDADEWLDERARQAVRRLLHTSPPDNVGGFRLKMRCHYLGKWITHGDWSQRKLRLIRHGHAHWSNDRLHESLRLTGGKCNDLPGRILHFPYRDLSHHLAKLDLYTDLAADLERSASLPRVWFGIILEPPLTFLHKYFIQLGFLDGLPGFIIAVMSAFYFFLRYTKVWRIKRELPARPPYRAPVSGMKRAEALVRLVAAPLASRIPIRLPRGIGEGLRIKGALSYCNLLRGDSVEDRFLRNLDFRDKTIVDAGGFLGIFTLFFARRAGENGRVYAFEPNPLLYGFLEQNIRQNGCRNATAFNLALGDRNGVAALHVPQPHLATGSLVERGDPGDHGTPLSVPVRKLDDAIDQLGLATPDFIKVDVEGLELQTLLGMKALLSTRAPELFIELHGGVDRQTLFELLIGHGYRIYHVEHGGYIEAADLKWMSAGHVYCHGDDPDHETAAPFDTRGSSHAGAG